MSSKHTRQLNRFLWSKVLSQKKHAAALLALVLLALCVQLGQAAYWSSGDELRMWMFDVGQGDAIFLQVPSGERVLIDGGRDQSVLSKLGNILLPWDRRIDLVVLTHPDADHVTGLVDVLERYDVGELMYTGSMSYSGAMQAYLDRASKEERRDVNPVAGQKVLFGDVELQILWPEEVIPESTVVHDRNNESIVIEVVYGETSILLTGDIEEETEQALLPTLEDIDVLKVGHHGSRTSSSVPFLEDTQPEFALISAGEDNSYGHPHEIVLKRLQSVGAQIFRTDLDGDLLLRSDGGEPTVVAHPLIF